MIKVDRETAVLEGSMEELHSEWVVATMAIYKKLKELGNDDETIEDFLDESLGLAFSMNEE